MSSSTVILPLERSRYFEDENGDLATTKREDDDLSLTLDFTDQLASGETVSSVSHEASGVTISNESTSSPTHTFTVTGIGYTEITVTMSTGRDLVKRVVFYDSDGVRALDYQGGWV